MGRATPTAASIWRNDGEIPWRAGLWTIVAVWVIVMVPAAYFMLKHSFEVLFGSK